jgi:hypothetical protein
MVRTRFGLLLALSVPIVISAAFSITDWRLTDLGMVVVLSLCAVALALAGWLLRWPFGQDDTHSASAPEKRAPRSTFIKAGDGAVIDIEDSYTNADTFLDLGDRPSVKGRRNTHDPKGGAGGKASKK